MCILILLFLIIYCVWLLYEQHQRTLLMERQLQDVKNNNTTAHHVIDHVHKNMTSDIGTMKQVVDDQAVFVKYLDSTHKNMESNIDSTHQLLNNNFEQIKNTTALHRDTMGISSNIDYITDTLKQVDQLDNQFAYLRSSLTNDISNLTTINIENDATKAYQNILDQKSRAHNSQLQQMNINQGLGNINADMKQMQGVLAQYADRLYMLDKLDETFVSKSQLQTLSNLYHHSVIDYKFLKDTDSLSNISMFKDKLNETEEKYKSIKAAYMSFSNTIVNTLQLTNQLSGIVDINNTIVKPLNELERSMFENVTYTSLANNLDDSFAKYKELKDIQNKLDTSFKPLLDGYLQEKSVLGKNIDTLVSDVEKHYSQSVDLSFEKNEWEKFMTTLKPVDKSVTSGDQSFEAPTMHVTASGPGSQPGEFCVGDGNDNTCLTGKQLKDALSKWIEID